MLTGDENIVELQLFVQYRVQDPVKFLFGASDPEGILHTSAEVALRSAVGRNTIDYTMPQVHQVRQSRFYGHSQFCLAFCRRAGQILSVLSTTTAR